jgi:predicted transcriptional regulator/transcriptional regulator with XRE-family HTH domain
LSQTALAKAALISPSYLNLIEHNKRGIAGRVLINLARALDLPPSALSKEAELSLIGDLRHAASETEVTTAETDLTEEFVSRYPGWARLANALFRTTERQRATIDALSDRLTHDPFLQDTIHEVLTRVTAVHSTAGILESVSDLPEDRRARFVSNLYAESGRLAEVAEALTRYFDQTVEDERESALPGEEIERFLDARNHRIEELEGLSTAEEAQEQITALLSQDNQFETDESREAATRVLQRYADDAGAMPLTEFSEAARTTAYDPLALAHRFGQSLEGVLRRMSSLAQNADQDDLALFGLIRTNAAGHVLDRQPITGFPMPRHGAPCALWPLYRAQALPDQILVQPVELPNGLRFETVSAGHLSRPDALNDPSIFSASMLIVASEDAKGMAFARPDTPALPIGSGCRICPRKACTARVETPILSDDGI